MAPGVDGASRELDRKCPVPVGTREWAPVKDKERPALAGFLLRDPEAMAGEPSTQID